MPSMQHEARLKVLLDQRERFWDMSASTIFRIASIRGKSLDNSSGLHHGYGRS